MMIERTKRRGIRSAQIIFSLMSVFVLLLILKNSKMAIDYMSEGMKLCTTTVIPALFPFMVISELIVKSGAASAAGELLRPVMSRFFGLGGGCGSAFLLGTVCGFPIGTRSAVSLFREGSISKDELERVICFSNNPSSAFVISAAGASLFGSKRLGTALYFITLLSAVIVGFIMNAGKRGKRQMTPKGCRKKAKLQGFSFTSLTEAISSSALGMLNVCAYVVFFCAFVGVLGSTFGRLSDSQALKAILFSFFEMTSGVSAASGVLPLTSGIVICAFALGFSGLSVHLQVASLCDGIDISFGPYFLSKLLQGIICSCLAWGYLTLFGERLEFDAESVVTVFDNFDASIFSACMCVAFLASVFVLLTRRKKELLQKAKAPKK